MGNLLGLTSLLACSGETGCLPETPTWRLHETLRPLCPRNQYPRCDKVELIAAELVPSSYNKRSNKRSKHQKSVFYLARPGVAGRADLKARIPELAPLANHAVALFGLGCIGAPSA